MHVNKFFDISFSTQFRPGIKRATLRYQTHSPRRCFGELDFSAKGRYKGIKRLLRGAPARGIVNEVHVCTVNRSISELFVAAVLLLCRPADFPATVALVPTTGRSGGPIRTVVSRLLDRRSTVNVLTASRASR